MRGKPGLFREQESEKSLELLIAHGVQCAAHQWDVLAAFFSSIAYP
jgi:hypothetical protein